jgi:hypothetical protein
LANAAQTAPDRAEHIQILYRKILSRNPTATELDRGVHFLTNGTPAQYAQILLSVNEEIFWP